MSSRAPEAASISASKTAKRDVMTTIAASSTTTVPQVAASSTMPKIAALTRMLTMPIDVAPGPANDVDDDDDDVKKRRPI